MVQTLSGNLFLAVYTISGADLLWSRQRIK